MKSSERPASAERLSAEDVAANVASASGMSNDRMLTRGKVAEILGMSPSSVLRLDASVLPAIVDQRGTRHYSERRVFAYAVERAAAGDRSGAGEGAIASAAFERFDRGASPVDVVKDLKITPRAAGELLAEWADLGGGFVVSGTAAAKIQQLAWERDEIEVKNGNDIVAVLEQIDRTACSSCERRTPRLCLRCYSTRPPRAQKLLGAAMAASASRREELARKETERQVVERARHRLADLRDDVTEGEASAACAHEPDGVPIAPPARKVSRGTI